MRLWAYLSRETWKRPVAAILSGVVPFDRSVWLDNGNSFIDESLVQWISIYWSSSLFEIFRAMASELINKLMSGTVHVLVIIWVFKQFLSSASPKPLWFRWLRHISCRKARTSESAMSCCRSLASSKKKTEKLLEIWEGAGETIRNKLDKRPQNHPK